jgi:hypothetical protein
MATNNTNSAVSNKDNEQPTDEQLVLAVYFDMPPAEAGKIAFTTSRIKPHRSNGGVRMFSRTIHVSYPLYCSLRQTADGVLVPAR